jgi:hypothetical protein
MILVDCMMYIPGAFTTSPSTLAAMLSESFPPSTAIPNSDITLHIAVQASYKAAPSPGSFAAHIQFPLHFTSCNKQLGQYESSQAVIVKPLSIISEGTMKNK